MDAGDLIKVAAGAERLLTVTADRIVKHCVPAMPAVCAPPMMILEIGNVVGRRGFPMSSARLGHRWHRGRYTAN